MLGIIADCELVLEKEPPKLCPNFLYIYMYKLVGTVKVTNWGTNGEKSVYDFGSYITAHAPNGRHMHDYNHGAEQ